jgi:hypothetical protein
MNRRGDTSVLKIALFLLLFLSPFAGNTTQQPTATRITGVITDATGASLSKARVLVVDLATLDTQKMEVGLDGGFEFAVSPVDHAVIAAGPLDTPCWKPAVRQIGTGESAHLPLRIPLMLDMKKCPEGE